MKNKTIKLESVEMEQLIQHINAQAPTVSTLPPLVVERGSATINILALDDLWVDLRAVANIQ